MKFILVLLTWLMVPLAVIVVAFDIAKAFVEEKAVDTLTEKNT